VSTDDSVQRRQILDSDGAVLPDATVPDLSDATLVSMYRDMLFARRLDERAISLQRRGEMGTYASMYGHEAAQIGSVAAIAADDWLFHSYREHGATVAHGLPPENVLIYHMGYELGSDVPEDVQVFPICGSIAGQIPHATGMAWAARIRDDDRAALCHFGDGATSEGDFHEALNFAGVFDAPAVFFCNNNQWAISTPIERQTRSETIAQKATAYGFAGVQVDGMDPLAVYQVTREAVEKAKDPGEGELRPTLIEATLYRLSAHNTTDDPSNYRDEVPEEWEEKNPLPRFESFLRETGRLDDDRHEALEADVEAGVDEAIDAALALGEPETDDMFEFVFETPTDRQREQREHLSRLIEKYGDDAFSEG
jgi:pyruvate dehydrogenase E1 component alpha subunit